MTHFCGLVSSQLPHMFSLGMGICLVSCVSLELTELTPCSPKCLTTTHLVALYSIAIHSDFASFEVPSDVTSVAICHVIGSNEAHQKGSVSSAVSC